MRSASGQSTATASSKGKGKGKGWSKAGSELDGEVSDSESVGGDKEEDGEDYVVRTDHLGQ